VIRHAAVFLIVSFSALLFFRRAFFNFDSLCPSISYFGFDGTLGDSRAPLE